MSTHLESGLIDIGVNLSSKKFKYPRSIVEKAKTDGLTHMILTGTSYQNSLKSIELCRSLSDIMPVYCTVGIHPHDSKTWRNSTYDDLKKMINSNRDVVVAVGETGLDYDKDRMFSSVAEQHHAFRHQIRLALEMNLPLFLHDRVATKDFITVMSEEDKFNKLTKVVHCFTSGYDELVAYLNAGCFVGITGWINDKRRNHDLIDALTRVNADDHYRTKLMERIMIETDAPFLSPVKNVRINEPSNVVFVLNELANVLKMSVSRLKQICYQNTVRVFNLVKPDIKTSDDLHGTQVQVAQNDVVQNEVVQIDRKTQDTTISNIEINTKPNTQNTAKRIVSYRDAVLKNK